MKRHKGRRHVSVDRGGPCRGGWTSSLVTYGDLEAHVYLILPKMFIEHQKYALC